MDIQEHYTIQGTLSLRYSTTHEGNRVAEIEERAIALFAKLGMEDYRITGITMDHETYSPVVMEARVEFNTIGDYEQ